MKKTIYVPKNKHPLDVLRELGDLTKDAWIYIHADLVKRLVDSAYDFDYNDFEHHLIWKKSAENPPETKIILVPSHKRWCFFTKILSDNISFHVPSDEPEKFIFLRAAE